jgi:hypothetical protein
LVRADDGTDLEAVPSAGDRARVSEERIVGDERQLRVDVREARILAHAVGWAEGVRPRAVVYRAVEEPPLATDVVEPAADLEAGEPVQRVRGDAEDLPRDEHRDFLTLDVDAGSRRRLEAIVRQEVVRHLRQP